MEKINITGLRPVRMGRASIVLTDGEREFYATRKVANWVFSSGEKETFVVARPKRVRNSAGEMEFTGVHILWLTAPSIF